MTATPAWAQALGESSTSEEWEKHQVQVRVWKIAMSHIPEHQAGLRSSSRVILRREEAYGEHFGMALRAQFLEGDAYVVDKDVTNVPATWWDPWKVEHPWCHSVLFRWFVKAPRWKEIVSRTEIRNVCPHIPLPSGKHGACVEFLVRRPPRGDKVA